MKDDAPVFEPYSASDFSQAIRIVNSQRCQRCESSIRFNNQSTKPDGDKIITLDGVCSECGFRHGIRFKIENITIQGV